MSYIVPQQRGQGLSALLYEARLSFARDYLSWTKLVISHHEDNHISKRAIQKHGFIPISTKEVMWGDGRTAIDYEYELDLEVLRQKNATL